ncbi:MAG: glycoside hydrolase family 55 protein [Kiritimatiellae bacterium]|nr:glycoside hydrolase family 55 protein [Kiritimatiellia bacterium]
MSAEIFPGELNVRDFGAIGNGVADDTAAIDRAIKAAQRHDAERASPRGTMGENDGPHQAVVFPRGVYRMTTTVFTGRDAHLRGLPGALIVMDNADADIFYFHHGTRVQVEGLHFKGGRHQLNLATLNQENANFHVRKCVFEGAASNGIFSVSRALQGNKATALGEFMPAADGVFRRDARFPGARPYNNSTFYLIEDSFFDRCAHAVEFHSDGGVVRNCRVIHPAHSSGAPFIGPSIAASSSQEVHYYGLDVLVERNGLDNQAFFDLRRGTHVLAIDDSSFRTSDGSGIPLFDSWSASPYFFTSYIVKNCDVTCGGLPEQGIIRLHRGSAPQILAFENVRDVTGKPVRLIASEGEVDEAWLRQALDRFNSPRITMNQRYTFTFGSCSANVLTDLGPYLNRFVKPFPKDLPLVNVPRRICRAYAGKVLRAADYGVVADGKTDDTAAMQRFADTLADEPESVGMLPPEWICLSHPVVLRGKIALVGAGRSAFCQGNGASAFFRIANGAAVQLKNLVFQDGKHVVAYNEDAALSTQILLDNCFAFNTVRWDKFDGAMFDLRAGQNATAAELRVTGGSYYASVLYRGNVTVHLDGLWFRSLPRTADKDTTWSTSMVNEKGGQLRLTDVLGVPIALLHKGREARNDPSVKRGDFRWIDNYGTLQAEHVRFGGEYGGLVPVYAFGDAKTYIVGQFGEYKTFCCRQAPIFTDSDNAVSVMFSTLSISRPMLPEQTNRIRFENWLWLRQ